MKGILFKSIFIPMIQAGRKTQTRRFHKREFEIGDILYLKENYNTKQDGADIIEIKNKWYELCCNISQEEACAEGFDSARDFRTCISLMYGMAALKKIIVCYEFDYLGKENKALKKKK